MTNAGLMIEMLGRVSGGEDLSTEQMTLVIDLIMQGGCPDVQIGLLLTALHAKGETVDEIAGAALALRQHMTPISSQRSNLLDTCGTGGSGCGAFNISTAAALVAAAAGAAVAKHGNRKITSKSGSADVLTELGVEINADTATVERCLDELGVCFCFAPALHPSMKHVSVIRRELGFPTIFNLLGPLCNPAGASRQLLGVGKPELRNTLAAALAKLGSERAAVVAGSDGLGEVTLSGPTDVTEIRHGVLTETTWTPADFGLENAPLSAVLAEGPQQSAAIIQAVLTGERGPHRDIVVANAAAALYVAEVAPDLAAGAERAAAAIDSGAAAACLEKLARISHEGGRPAST
ncbi:anthranilate phosphoribosyltransferase [Lignipirellula cremea]|uniref:Anthranilate phosphoribosyltransferase n=1 Tax=Lignipirellula cremea TaxID=2528010 RepID=A0A518E373_9BACT|nr:anthranilate phosphoribosyltransferase [Lignipirellula cremea]QDU98493.1 Anthranilate phosphoribosyltransferase [Lignipirellula cremea]